MVAQGAIRVERWQDGEPVDEALGRDFESARNVDPYDPIGERRPLRNKPLLAWLSGEKMKPIYSFTYNNRRVELRETVLPPLAIIGGLTPSDPEFCTYIDVRCVSGSAIGTAGILCEDPDRREIWQKQVKQYINDESDRG